MKRLSASVLMAMVALLLTLAEAAPPEDVPDLPSTGPASISKVLVWKVLAPPDLGDGVRTCPVCKVSQFEGELLPAGIENMTAYLRRGLNSVEGCVFLRYGEEDKEGSETPSIEEILKEAETRGADSALVPVLLRYRELQGKSWAAKTPASVAFHLHMYGVAGARDIWSFMYSETQRPLSENLLDIVKFWKRKAKWVKASQLLKEGIDKAITGFPKCGEESP